MYLSTCLLVGESTPHHLQTFLPSFPPILFTCQPIYSSIILLGSLPTNQSLSIYVPTYLPNYVPPTYLPNYLYMYLLACFLTYLSTNVFTAFNCILPLYLPFYIFTYRTIHLPTYLPVFIPVSLCICLLNYRQCRSCSYTFSYCSTDPHISPLDLPTDQLTCLICMNLPPIWCFLASSKAKK